MRKLAPMGLLFLVLLFGCSKMTLEEQAENVLSNYLSALENHDINALVKYSDDLRFPDKSVQKENYLDIEHTNPIAKIIELQSISPTEFEATVEIVEEDGQLELTLPIQQKKNKWKVIVGQDL
ncbi:hypothetical protein MKY41_13825 [Sporosarcina sp. FSL W7-1349]|uniref:hypothetical protein n=1 Tax=Sporosarcina sp. FSL W7-1349 TaxID=2921561 RepID=UPI0030FA23DE